MFFRYPGGKRRLRKPILQKLLALCGPHITEYAEPFFGSGAIGIQLLSSGWSKNLWFNDHDAGIAALWNAVLTSPRDLQKRIREFVPSVDAFLAFKAELLEGTAGTGIDLAFKKLVVHQLSYSGLGTRSGGPLGGLEQRSQYKIDCRWSPEHMCKKIEKLHALLAPSRVQITCLNYEVLLESSDHVLFYLDPPYYTENLYQHSFTVDDHARLADRLKSCKNWVLSYDDCPEIKELYAWAKVETIDAVYTLNNKHSKQKKELLVTSC